MATPAANYETARNAYFDNADYDAGSGSITKAEAYKTAIRQLLGFAERGTHGGAGGESYAMNHSVLLEQLKQVEAWIAQNAATAGTGGAVYYDLGRFRD